MTRKTRNSLAALAGAAILILGLAACQGTAKASPVGNWLNTEYGLVLDIRADGTLLASSENVPGQPGSWKSTDGDKLVITMPDGDNQATLTNGELHMTSGPGTLIFTRIESLPAYADPANAAAPGKATNPLANSPLLGSWTNGDADNIRLVFTDDGMGTWTDGQVAKGGEWTQPQADATVYNLSLSDEVYTIELIRGSEGADILNVTGQSSQKTENYMRD